MSALDDALYYGRQCIGVPYGFWGGGAIEDWAPMFGNAPGLTTNDVTTVNCSGLINAIRTLSTGGAPQIGGTLAYGDYTPYSFDASYWHKVGTLLLEPFGGGAEGHIVMVSHPGQWVIQSNVAWGVTESIKAAEQHSYTPFYYCGWMPNFPASDYYPGAANGEPLGVEGYPGDYATPRQWAHWAGRVASEIYGIPPTLPVLVMCEEWYGGGSGPMYQDADTPLDITSYPGYSSAVDYDSTGWFQQRYVYFGDATNAEHALGMFLNNALDVAPSMPYPTDRNSIAQWAYDNQRSGDPADFASHWDRVLELLDGYEPPEPTPTPTPIPIPEDIVYDEMVFVAGPDAVEDRAYAYAAGMVLDAVGVGNQVFTEDENIVKVSEAALSGKNNAPTVFVVGSEAEAHLSTSATGKVDSHLWHVFVDSQKEDEAVTTLRGMRETVLPFFEDKHKGVVDRFDAVLMSLDGKYSELIAKSEQDGPKPEPPPAPPPPEHWQARGWIRTYYADEKRLRFEPEGSKYADPWFELVTRDEVEGDDLVLKLRRQ